MSTQLCDAVIWRGSRWGDTPEPDEYCDNDVMVGSDYCAMHQESDE